MLHSKSDDDIPVAAAAVVAVAADPASVRVPGLSDELLAIMTPFCQAHAEQHGKEFGVVVNDLVQWAIAEAPNFNMTWEEYIREYTAQRAAENNLKATTTPVVAVAVAAHPPAPSNFNGSSTPAPFNFGGGFSTPAPAQAPFNFGGNSTPAPFNFGAAPKQAPFSFGSSTPAPVSSAFSSAPAPFNSGGFSTLSGAPAPTSPLFLDSPQELSRSKGTQGSPLFASPPAPAPAPLANTIEYQEMIPKLLFVDMQQEDEEKVAAAVTKLAGLLNKSKLCNPTNILCNRDGAPVAFGTAQDMDRLYCGRNLGRDAIPGSDGRCGPSDGPQCQACQELPNWKVNADQAHSLGAIAIVLLLMRKWHCDRSIQFQGCNVLAWLTWLTSSNREQLTNDEGAPVAFGTSATMSLCCGRRVEPRQGFGYITCTGKAHAPQCPSCQRLQRSYQHTRARAVSIVKSGGIETIMASMKSFPHDDGIQCNGCSAIGDAFFYADPTIDKAMAHFVYKLNGIELVVLVMRKFHYNASVQDDGCYVLQQLSKKQVLHDALKKGGALTAVSEATGKHDSNRLQARATAFFKNMFGSK